MTLLIDADWLIYSSCCACEQDIRWDTNLHTLHADERDVNEIKKDYLKGLRFHYVTEMSEVIDIAITNQKAKNYKTLQ